MANINKKNRDTLSIIDNRGIDKDIKNLSSVIKSVRELKLIKSNYSKMNFLTLGAKEAFIHLQKAFIKTLILYYFDKKRHIWIETNALGYAINEILSQLTSEVDLAIYKIHESNNKLNPLSKIG